MKPSLFVRTIADHEHQALEEGVFSSDHILKLHCQILLSSERGERPLLIARDLGCSDVTVRNVINAFNKMGLVSLKSLRSR